MEYLEESRGGVRIRRACAIWVVFWSTLVAACGPGPPREREIRQTRVLTVVGGTEPWGAGAAARFGLRVPGTAPGAAEGASGFRPAAPGAPMEPVAVGEGPPTRLQRTAGLAWDVPVGWTRLPDRAFRVATFAAGSRGEAECSVTLLSGRGGGLEANLERWRGQLGAEGTPGVVSAQETLQVLGGDAQLVVLEGVGKYGPAAILGLVRLLPGRALFVKMSGPRDAVLTERRAFERFVRSLLEDG